MVSPLQQIEKEVTACHACPRLVAWREQVGTEKRAAYIDDTYHAKGVPGFGDPSARLVIVGLAPAAHGANRTGRMFTGDRSGDWLYAALHRAGYANQPTSTHAKDGMKLTDAWITAPVKCAPPANKPTPAERDTCLPYLQRELAALRNAQVIVALGRFAYEVIWKQFGPGVRPNFSHSGVAELADGLHLICSYHVSQQNTFTGKLTEAMLDDIFQKARQLSQ